MQDDILEATLTPREILLFTAKLKLNVSEIEKEKRVDKMMKELNLGHCRDTQIGNNLIRGVSGGERKRTSIAVELISDPQIVFLDEPTTGLDSYNAYEVVQKICNLAQIEGKIILFTIHQPSSEIYSLLDKILILADGKTVYYGPAKKSLSFFTEELKINYPLNYNPFEFFLEITNYEILNNRKIKQIKAYGDILNGTENMNDKEKLKSYTDYISLLADIFSGKKKLTTFNEEKNNFIEINCIEDKNIINRFSEKGFENDGKFKNQNLFYEINFKSKLIKIL